MPPLVPTIPPSSPGRIRDGLIPPSHAALHGLTHREAALPSRIHLHVFCAEIRNCRKGPNRLSLTSERGHKRGRRQETIPLLRRFGDLQTEEDAGSVGSHGAVKLCPSACAACHIISLRRCENGFSANRNVVPAPGLVIAPVVINFHYYVSTHRRYEGTQPGRGASLLPRRRRERQRAHTAGTCPSGYESAELSAEPRLTRSFTKKP